jgi:glycosyltransferase involved in cell wall biosynthesis
MEYDQAAARSMIGVVVIGRNEGERLACCLESVRDHAERLVYVDSGSTDGSVAHARGAVTAVVELDLRIPFTAARARNEGFRRLLELRPDLDYVFFVDGDCEVVDGWLDKACRFLDQHADVAIVWGFRRERYPEKSVYNMLCDIEWWDYPTGETRICGGDALIRATAFRQVEGYRNDLICGEEPEMCVRLRQARWRIWRLKEPMTVHDAAIYHFGQWWKRTLRGGYSFAQGAAIHGGQPERHGIRESRRAWLWGLGIPALIAALAYPIGWWSALLLLIYPLQISRIALSGRRTWRANWWRAGALVVGKFPEMLGQLKFQWDRCRRVQSQLIEYK